MMDSETEGCKDLSEMVARPIWEPRHEWQSRVMFVEDHVADYESLEKAINLSIVWANMKFLECSYPQGTEAMVSDYPVPSLDVLRARKWKNKCDANESSSSKRISDVSDLISSVHTQSSAMATHVTIQSIANEMCLCKECLQLTGKESFTSKGKKILECYGNIQKSIKSEVIRDTDSQDESWSLVVNGEAVIKRSGPELAFFEDFVKMLINWQEANQKPACPVVATKSVQGSGFQAGSDYQPCSYSSSPNSGGGYGGRQGYASGGGQQQSENKWSRGRGYNHGYQY